MKNIMHINGLPAVIAYAPEIGLLRGEFTGLNGGADFYAADIDSLRRGGGISLNEFLAVCREKGREPRRAYSGNFHLRISPALHKRAAQAAAAENKSLNRWIEDTLARAL